MNSITKDSPTLCLTKSGKLVNCITTIEFARLIFKNPATVYGFTTTLRDAHEDPRKTIYPWPFYYAVSLNLIDTQSVYMNRECIIGGAPFTFDLASYDCRYRPEDQTDAEACLQELVDGLHLFQEMYGNEADTWYITSDTGMLDVHYHERGKR